VDEVASGLHPEARETLQLLVSELVTNSVRHGRLGEMQWIDLCLEATPRSVRVSVKDPGVGFDWPVGPPRPGDPSGWGLYLVEQMADRWGVTRNDETQVWFEIAR
jgi:anti-sigma regulatory factor (Ser/Thr protein kinase)